MNYIYTISPIEQAALATVGVLRTHLLKGERVLWLLSGGSSLDVAVIASKSNRLRDIDLSKLYVSMTDERYGAIGHADESWQQLLNAGFSLPGANLYRPLIGQSVEQTTAAFNYWLGVQFLESDYKLGIFGLGVDGHTAGIKPNSAVSGKPEPTDLASSYVSDDFERITMNFIAITHLEEAIIQASGVEKQSIVSDLIYDDSYPLDQQPAQVLKKVPIATLYTDIQKKGV